MNFTKVEAAIFFSDFTLYSVMIFMVKIYDISHVYGLTIAEGSG